MAIKVTDDTNYVNIANAIREKTSSQDTFSPSQMAGAIRSISGGTGGGYTTAETDALLALKQDLSDAQAVNTALSTFLTALKTLIPQIVYSTASHNGANVVSSAQALIEVIGGGGGGTVAVTGVSFASNSGSVAEGSTKTLTVIFAPSNATDKTGTWASSNTSIATVGSSTSGSCVVTGVAEGSANITFTSHDGGYTATYALTVTASSAPTTYTPQVLYSNYTATGARFSTDNLSIDFANGDYVEALIDVTTCTQDAENILSVGAADSSNIESYDSANAILVYKRAQSGTDKILFRLKDTVGGKTSDKWVVPSSYSTVLIRIDKDGVFLDGTSVGITVSDLSRILGLGTYIIGARASKLSRASYDHVTIFRKN